MKEGWIALLLLLCLQASGQDFEAANYKWAGQPAWQTLSTTEASSMAVVLKDHRMLEYQVDRSDRLFEYDTRHRIVRVNTDEAIEQFNKVFIPVGEGEEVVSIAARTVSEKGVLQELNKDNIKEVENVEEYGSFKIFAIEGVEIGSNIEYLYTVRKTPNFFGRQVFQKSLPVKNASLKIISPEHLVYITQPYNGFPDLKLTTKEGKRILEGTIDAIAPLQEEEPYAAVWANAMRVDYKISHNTKMSDREMFTWTDAAQRIHEVIYTTTDKEEKAIKKELNKVNINRLKEEEKVRAIEHYLKTEILFRDGMDVEEQNLETILTMRTTNTKGMVRLFAAMLKQAKVPFELVLTCDRTEQRFDKEFMTWNYLENYLIYLNGLKKFLAPANPEFRLGLFPYTWSGHDGLFIREVQLGAINTAYGQVRNIPEVTMEEQFDNMEMKVSFTDDMKACKVDVKRSFGGHNAMFIQPYYDLIPPTDQENVLEELLQFLGSDVEVADKNITGTDRSRSPLDEALVMSGQLTVPSAVEKAGSDHLFLIGNLIGQQVEMYQEKDRQNPVEIEYPHQYDRTINVTLPEGYTVKGLDELKINLEYGDEKGNTMGFISNYNLNGNQLKVYIYEYYKNTYYPLEQFNEFREVINAAADFNKVVLVLEKN